MNAVYESMQFKDDIVFVGHLEIPDLAPLVAASAGVVYASQFEGFGIPITEAMQSHVPVITSNISSMPEVAGDAAILVNPHSVDELKQAMQRIVTDKSLRNTLIERGITQAQKFNWQYTADGVWKAVEDLLEKVKKK